uniref:Uncharacterized protein n=1 Tax=Oryza sativa subsp. japonica TaxID=39947 RepID=Q8S6K0_ORYSJ|nr:Hypothetical protein [Oryza sativa Japonica Group]
MAAAAGSAKEEFAAAAPGSVEGGAGRWRCRSGRSAPGGRHRARWGSATCVGEDAGGDDKEGQHLSGQCRGSWEDDGGGGGLGGGGAWLGGGRRRSVEAAPGSVEEAGSVVAAAGSVAAVAVSVAVAAREDDGGEVRVRVLRRRETVVGLRKIFDPI